MLKIENVNKYFNRHKKNEIHVINNTTLEFPNTGLVALLGPSGCGKTTLLNAIGGLDRINSGRIIIDGKKMPRICSAKKDKMRVLNIGYIFQNYELIENLSVYDNIALSLKMIGIKNKTEIKERVNYVLEKVDMYRYRNKPAGMLSGGEKQRVVIARAIVKNPAIIIADEPTGNLDSKNTIEIMNIIKSISQDKLVILVTHERNLADFYASRIVSLEDGKVIDDKLNVHKDDLDYRIDNKIYLKDFKEVSNLKDSKHDIKIYQDSKETLDLDIVIKNGNLYIKSGSVNKIEVVDDDSNIEFINDHYKKITKDDYEKSNFDLSKLDNSKHRLRYTSIYNVISMIRAGINKVYNYTIMKKILLLGFFISAMFILYSISNIFGATRVDESKFLKSHRDYITIKNSKNTLDDYLKLESDENIDYILPGDSNVTLKIIKNTIYQFKNADISISGSLASKELATNIIVGENIKEKNEIVVDKLILDMALKESRFIMVGINNYEDLIGKEVQVDNMPNFVIVGVSDSNSPCIYMDSSNFTNILASAPSDIISFGYYNYDNNSNIVDYELVKDSITIKQGRAPINDYEVIVNIDNEYSMPLYKEIDTKVGDRKLLVVGYYYSPKDAIGYYVNTNTIKYSNILNKQNMTIYGKDKENTIEYLKANGYNAIDTYNKDKKEYKKETADEVRGAVILAAILLFISFIEIFLMIRASFLSRIKEIGIYRAIGVKKLDIYKMFLGEILVITTIAGIPGYILMACIINELTKISIISDRFVLNTFVLVLCFIIIYALNIVVGLLPIRNVIRKTPHEILSRTDVD